MDEQAIEFLKESNNIEDEWGDDELAQALYAWNYLSSQEELTPHVVLQTHKILMLHKLVDDQKGYFRKTGVRIGERFGKPWYAVPILINEWCLDIAGTLKIYKIYKAGVCVQNIEKYIQDMHVLYEEIHPFVDGNGRTGRMFMNWMRLQFGLPILIIKASEKAEYYKWFDEPIGKMELWLQATEIPGFIKDENDL